jgi:glyoxylase-like metal-dependent hydrolase (beta-lactamase superfamily II)
MPAPLPFVAAFTVVLALVQAQSPAKPPLVRVGATVKVSPHVFVIPDDSVPMVPNVGLIVGSRATLVVDTGLGARNAQTVLAEVAKVSSNTDLYLVTTHVHPEHDLGAGAFPASTKLIRSRAQVDEIAASGLELAKRFAGISPLHAELLQGAEFRKADIVFDQEHALDLGGVRVRILAMGFNHTRGDTATFIEPDAVLFSGDVSMRAAPAVATGSTFATWIASQDRFEALKPARVVPSHGPMGEVSMIATNKRFLTTVQTRASELKKAGKTADETVAALQPEFEPIYGTSPRVAATIRAAYTEAP